MMIDVLGRFIVLEGLDGSGSSTQARMLSEKLVQNGRRVWQTSEPSSGLVGKLIKQLFSGTVVLPPDCDVRDRQFAYLFAADRFDHLHNPTTGVLKHLAESVDVVSTRYFFSSLAYNAETAEGQSLVRRLNADFPAPDGLVYLDCPVDISIRRLTHSRPRLDTYENRDKLLNVRENYDKVIGEYKGRKLIVDASLPRNVIAEKIFDFVTLTHPTLAELSRTHSAHELVEELVVEAERK